MILLKLFDSTIIIVIRVHQIFKEIDIVSILTSFVGTAGKELQEMLMLELAKQIAEMELINLKKLKKN